MDFLPVDYFTRPSTATEHELIPDFGGPDYDNKGYMGYDARQGWVVKRTGGLLIIEQKGLTQFSQRRTKAVVQFLQTWVFFGLFQEALRRPISREECSFTSKDQNGSSKRYLSAQKLWTELMQRRKSLNADPAWSDNLISCLLDAAIILMLWGPNSAGDDEEVPGAGLIHLSLVLLLDSLRCELFQDKDSRLSTFFASSSEYLNLRLRREGWCPNMVQKLERSLFPAGMYYMSLLGQKFSVGLHKACSERFCGAYTVSEDTYVVQHDSRFCLNATQESSCQYSSNEVVRDVLEYVRKDQIPLLSYVEDTAGQRYLKVIPYKDGDNYVAISHVWCDGMGNPRENALPQCCLRAIDQNVRVLTHEGPNVSESPALFWIDTICVPLGPKPVRNVAIMSMERVYSRATYVLAMSGELVTTCVPPTTVETLALIYISKWTSRLWTLQEAVLTQNLAFQFYDRSVKMDDLFFSVFGVPAHHPAHQLICQIEIKHLFKSYMEKKSPLGFVWNMLRFRSTSKACDALICVPTLIRMPLQPLLDAPEEERIRMFWRSQRFVSSQVLWGNCQRLADHPLRWAPASLLGWNFGLTETYLLPLGQDGLEAVGLAGFVLHDCPAPQAETDRLEFVDKVSGVRCVVTKYGVSSERSFNESWAELTASWGSGSCAVLFSLTRMKSAETNAKEDAILVLIHRVDREVYYARWLAIVQVCHESRLPFMKKFKNLQVPTATRVRAEQKWCIG